MEKYLFYKFNVRQDNLLKQPPREIIGKFQYYIWRPSSLKIWPKGFLKYMKEMRKIPVLNMVYWWLVYKVIKRNNDYSIVIIKKNEDIAHYTVVLPKNYRFPFARERDLILGPVWTNPYYRKKGLVYYSLDIISQNYYEDSRQLWWICNENNIPSRISIEKAGFKYHGKGKIKNNWLKLFSYFEVDRVSNDFSKNKNGVNE